MKNLPDEERAKFKAQNEHRAVYEAPAVIHEGKISTRAQTGPNRDAQAGYSADASEDPFHV